MAETQVVKKKVGATGKFNDVTVKTLIDALSIGHTAKDACALAGISEETFYNWISPVDVAFKGNEFLESVKKAQLTAKDQCIKLVRKAALTSWQAAAWYLERKYRNEFALRQEITGADGAPLIQVVNYSEYDGADKNTVRRESGGQSLPPPSLPA